MSRDVCLDSMYGSRWPCHHDCFESLSTQQFTVAKAPALKTEAQLFHIIIYLHGQHPGFSRITHNSSAQLQWAKMCVCVWEKERGRVWGRLFSNRNKAFSSLGLGSVLCLGKSIPVSKAVRLCALSSLPLSMSFYSQKLQCIRIWAGLCCWWKNWIRCRGDISLWKYLEELLTSK